MRHVCTLRDGVARDHDISIVDMGKTDKPVEIGSYSKYLALGKLIDVGASETSVRLTKLFC